MSNKETTTATLATGAMNVQWDTEDANNGNELFAKLKPLTEEQAEKGYYLEIKAGDVVEGILASVGVNKFGKEEYRIDSFTGGKTVVLANAGNLAYRIKEKNIAIGDALRITYNGKTPMASGKYKGTPAHNFSVVGEAV
jgi:hypothetical protein